MTPSKSQVVGWQTDFLATLAQQWSARAKAWERAFRAYRKAVTYPGGTDWTGVAATAAKTQADIEHQRATRAAETLTRLAAVAGDGAADLQICRANVLEAIAAATDAGFAVDDDLSVRDSRPAADDADARLVRAAQAEAFADDIRRKADALATRDGDVAAALRSGTAELAGYASRPDPGRLAATDDPAALAQQLTTMTPDERAEFLAHLSPDTVHAMVLADPETMGNTNGVPFDVRIAANDINIRNALAAELAKPQPDQARVDQLRAMLTPIDDPLSPAGLGQPRRQVNRQFVMFSTEGNGRMIELVGRIQPGIHGVGVIVPGASSNLNSSGWNHAAAVNLARASGSPVFLYLEGDFPQGVAAADKSYAAVMAPQLVAFGHEIDRAVAQSAPGTPVTYIGHSYGGAIVGTAEQLGLRADRIVHASSAGTGIYSSGYTDPNPNVQRYSMTAPGDSIAVVQSLPRDVGLSHIPGFDQIPGIPHTTDGQAGNPLGGLPGVSDPDKIPGVIRLDTGYYSPTGAHPGELIVGPEGHGSYWNDPGSDAFKNMAAVIGGGDATGYVERGVETNAVDINVGDDGNFRAESWDQLVAVADQKLAEQHPFGLPVPESWKQPWANPRVTDHPERGPAIHVK